MTRLLLTFIAALALISCARQEQTSSAPPNIPTPNNENAMLVGTQSEVFTLYRKTNNLFHVARVLRKASDDFDLLLYDVNAATAEGAAQKLVSSEHLTKLELDKRKPILQKDYIWSPLKVDQVLFVQIQPDTFKDEFELLDRRQKLEKQLDHTLESKNLGEWLASDIGPGGGNILYKVADIEQALNAVLEIVKQNGLENEVRVGRRVYVADRDWFYEVIYPSNFTGVFNTM